MQRNNLKKQSGSELFSRLRETSKRIFQPHIIILVLLFLLFTDIPSYTFAQDTYEPDGTFGKAKEIFINGNAQRHNFADIGDEDWIKFKVDKTQKIGIKTINSGINADAVIELYDTDGVSLLYVEDSERKDGDEYLRWLFTDLGTYYIKIRQSDPNDFGLNTGYDLLVEEIIITPKKLKFRDNYPIGPPWMLQWEPSDDTEFTKYYIWYKPEFCCAPYEGDGAIEPSPIDVDLDSLNDPDNPEFLITDLEAGVYFFAITGKGNEGESGYSNELSTAAPQITNPPNITYRSNNAVTIQWETNSHGNSEVRYGTVSSDWRDYAQSKVAT